MNNEIEKIKKFVRATNYLSVGQIYLQDNYLLKDKNMSNLKDIGCLNSIIIQRNKIYPRHFLKFFCCLSF